MQQNLNQPNQNNNISTQPTVKNGKNKRKVLVALLLCAVILVSFLGGFFTRFFTEQKSARIINEIMGYINNNSVMIDNIDAFDTAKSLVNGLMGEHDDYATYYTPEEYDKLKKEDGGNYQGIGISINKTTNQVFKVLGNSPAYHAGITSGEVLIGGKKSLEDEYLVFSTPTIAGDISASDFLASCKLGDAVFLKVENQQQREVQLVVSKYEVSYVQYFDNQKKASFITQNGQMILSSQSCTDMSNLDSSVGYIALSAFEGQASYQLGQMLNYLKGQNKTKLIFDLRNNGGGQMSVLCSIASYFILNGGNNSSPIVYAKGKNSTTTFTTGNNYVDLDEICVLANSNTASASECLIGAMLYYGASERKGNFGYQNLFITYNENRQNYTTYGKGIMQTIYPLLEGGALRLTTAYIYWPDNSTCIHSKGIETIAQNRVSDINAISSANQYLINN